MPRSAEARIGALERHLGGPGARREYSLLQVVHASYGREPGEPALLLKPGEPSVSELILETRTAAVPQ